LFTIILRVEESVQNISLSRCIVNWYCLLPY